MNWAYFKSCVDFNRHDVQYLDEMIDAGREITYRTIRKHLGEALDTWAKDHGYAQHPSQGLVLARDWAVSYCKSKYRGRPCYYVCWSCIEFIFLPDIPP